MKVNLEKAIKNINVTVGFFRPLYEAIVNSIQAKATTIDIVFDLDKQDYNDQINGYKIKDNGEGFTDENINAFLTLWTEHNSDLGALGSGRILCLKVFDNIIINSQTKDIEQSIGQNVNIDFHKKFEPNTKEDINPKKHSSKDQYTITHFKNLTSLYQDEKPVFNLDNLKKEFFMSLLPLFIEYNKNNKDLTITLQGEIWIDKKTLSKRFEELDFKEVIFNIKSSRKDDTTEYPFTLTYQINLDGKNSLHEFYGASFRKVTDFPNNTKIKRLPENASGTFCLSAKYLNERVSDSRESFTLGFNENNADADNPLLFRDINNSLSQELNKILRKSFKDIDNQLKNEKYEAIEEHPYLTPYINKIDKLTISKNDIVKIAQKEFDKKYKSTKKEIINFTKNMQKTKNFNRERYIEITRDFTEVGQEQLAHYIAYRQTIIEMLFNVNICNNDSTKESYSEDYIHNLIMPQKKIKTNDKHIITENNFWLFDDKFMSYSYSASDAQIQKILESLTLEMDDETKDYYGSDRPDLLMLYSDEMDNEKDVVIIELKKINAGHYEKEKAISQLSTYSRIIRNNIPNVKDIFVYAVFDLDHRLENILLDRGFYPKALTRDGHDMRAYYMYNESRKAHMNVLSFEHLLSDANKRNKLFLNILKNDITTTAAEND